MIDNIFGIVDNFNDLNKLKIYNLISQKGGGDNSSNIKLFLGIILIVVGLVFVYLVTCYNTTSATITNIDSDNLFKYVTLIYNVDNNQFNKQITLGHTHNLELGKTITIYYDKNDPNIISLDINSYYIIAIIFGICGFYIIFSNHITSTNLSSRESIYSTDENLSDIRLI